MGFIASRSPMGTVDADGQHSCSLGRVGMPSSTCHGFQSSLNGSKVSGKVDSLALFVYYGLFGCGDNEEEMKNDLKITLLGV
jgi:hypothetical protein